MDYRFKSRDIKASSRNKLASVVTSTVAGSGGGGGASACELEKVITILYNADGSIQGVQIEHPLAVKGGVAFYSGDTPLVQSIFAGLPIDGTTLYWQDGVLKSAGSGGGLSSVRINLGSVGYDSVDGVVNLPAYPTMLPASDVSAWAKAATKPSYAYSEISGTPTSLPANGGNADSLGNIAAADYWHKGNAGTSAYDWGCKRLFVNAGLTGLSENENEFGVSYMSAGVLPEGGGTKYALMGLLQTGWLDNGKSAHSNLYFRQRRWDGWSIWNKVWTDGNSNNSNADWTAKNLNVTSITTSSVNGVIIDSDGNMASKLGNETPMTNFFHIKKTDGTVGFRFNWVNGNIGIGVDPQYNLDVYKECRIGSVSGASTVIFGDSGGAMVLRGGGSKGSYGASASNYPVAAFENYGWNFTIQNTDGGQFGIWNAARTTKYFSVKNGGDAVLTGQFSCRNTVHTQGAAFYTSDMRKKSVIDHIDLSLLQIANAPAIRFAWKESKRIGVGGSAQYTESLVSELVMDTAEGKVMDYATTAYLFSVNVAKELYKFETDTDRRIRELENEVEQLKLKRNGNI